MTNLQIRQAVAADLDIVTDLYYEMEIHYEKGEAVGREVLRERLEQTVFGQTPLAKIYLAFWDGQLAAFAITAPLFSAKHATVALYLGDLFTTAGLRGRGIGRELLAYVAKITIEGGYSRLDWTTGAENQGARKLYDSIIESSHKIHYRLAGEALKNLADTANQQGEEKR
jgi:GNAT superfamily N-acetyltransferase